MAERRTGLLVSLVGILLLAGLPGEAQAKPDAAAHDQFAGAWRLVSIETVRPNGEVIYPFYGKHPQGLIMYDRSGWMSVQIVADPAPAVPTSQSREEVLVAPRKTKEPYDILSSTGTV